MLSLEIKLLCVQRLPWMAAQQKEKYSSKKQRAFKLQESVVSK